MKPTTIRPAVAADGPRIGEISYRSHTISYRGFASRSFTDAQVRSEHVAWWSERAGVTENEDRMFVAERDDGIIGFSFVGPLVRGYEFAEQVSGLAERGPVAVLYSIHVDPDRLGSGAGRSLIRTSLDHARDAGFASVVLDTHEANRRARRFYDAAGFEVALLVESEEGERLVIYRIGLT